MERSFRFVLALAAGLVAASAAGADDTLTGTLVTVDGDERSFTIQTSEGKRHTFFAPATIDVTALEPGSDLQVTAEPITDVSRDERRQATAVAVIQPDPERDEAGADAGHVPRDPASGGAPGGGQPSGGIPSGGVPSGGAPSGGLPTGGGTGSVGP